MDALKAGLANVELTDALSDAILSFVRISHDGHQDTNDTVQNLFSHLPITLRQEIQYKLSRDFLYKIPSLASLDKEILEYMSIFVEEIIFLPGDYIVTAGELKDHVSYIVSGQAVVINSEGQRRRVEEKEVIEARSASDFLDGGPRTGIKYPEEASYNCIAETVVIVYRLPMASLGHVLYSLAGDALDTEGEEGGFDGGVEPSSKNAPSKSWVEMGGEDELVLRHPRPTRPTRPLHPSATSVPSPPSRSSQLKHPRRPYRPADARTTISGSDDNDTGNNNSRKRVTWSVVPSTPLVSLKLKSMLIVQ